MWSLGGGTPWLSLGGKLLCCICRPLDRTATSPARGEDWGRVSPRVRRAQTMTRGDGVTIGGGRHRASISELVCQHASSIPFSSRGALYLLEQARYKFACVIITSARGRGQRFSDARRRLRIPLQLHQKQPQEHWLRLTQWPSPPAPGSRGT